MRRYTVYGFPRIFGSCLCSNNKKINIPGIMYTWPLCKKIPKTSAVSTQKLCRKNINGQTKAWNRQKWRDEEKTRCTQVREGRLHVNKTEGVKWKEGYFARNCRLANPNVSFAISFHFYYDWYCVHTNGYRFLSPINLIKRGTW